MIPNLGIRPAPLKGEIAVNIHLPSMDDAALNVAAPDESQELSRAYSQDFVADAEYIRSLPDLQNGPTSLIRGAQKFIQHVAFPIFVCRSGFKHEIQILWCWRLR